MPNLKTWWTWTKSFLKRVLVGSVVLTALLFVWQAAGFLPMLVIALSAVAVVVYVDRLKGEPS